MTDAKSVPKFSELSRGEHVRIIAASILRIVLGLLVIGLALAFVPETPGADMAGPVIVIVACTVIYVWYFRRQLKRIKRSKFPQLAAIEALILIATMFLAVFAAIYVVQSTANPASFSEPLDHFNAYYFALTILATVGFGDITPVTTAARATAMVQMAIDIAFVAVLVRIISTVATNTIKQRAGGVPQSDQEAGASRAD